MNYSEQEKVFISDDNDFSRQLTHDICKMPIRTDGILTNLKKQRSNKASGIDGIAAEFYKYAYEQIMEPLNILFNTIFDKGDFPQLWAEVLIIVQFIKKAQRILLIISEK